MWHIFFSRKDKAGFLKVIKLYITALITLLVSCNSVSEQEKVEPDKGDLFLISNLYRQALLSLKACDEALTRSTYVETKNLAYDIKTSHAKVKIDIEALAGRKDFELPLDITATQLKSWQELVKKKGLEFDRVFLQLITHINNTEHALIDKIVAEAKDVEFKKAGNNVLADISSKEELTKQVQQLTRQTIAKDSIAKPATYK